MTVGGDAPVVVQSMTNTRTTDVEATVNQIKALERVGYIALARRLRQRAYVRLRRDQPAPNSLSYCLPSAEINFAP